MTKKILKIGGVVVGIIILILIGLLANMWIKQKTEKVKIGLSESKFPYRDYTEEELGKMYPQIRYADVPTRVTPEETYAKFRQALKDNNLEMAIEQLSKSSDKRYEENVADLKKAFEENRFKDVYNNYPEDITEEMMSESIAQFYFSYREKEIQRTHFIDFVKNSDGDWKMDNF